MNNKKISNLKIVLICILTTIIINVFFWIFILPNMLDKISSKDNQTSKQITTSQTHNNNITDVIKKSKGSVITVINQTLVTSNNLSDEQIIQEFFNNGQLPDQTVVDQTIGSGFIFKKEQNKYYALTNAHVVNKAASIEIQIDSEKRQKADIVAVNADQDVAVISFESKKDIPVLEFADSEKLTLGEDVIAIGSPLSLDYRNTVTKGIISKLPFDQNVDETRILKTVQTDAPINPGNSGGPLIDLDGKVVGMNTFKHSDAQNLNFALPANQIKKIAEELLKK